MMAILRSARTVVASAFLATLVSLAAAASVGQAPLIVGDFSHELKSGLPPGWQLVKRFGSPDIRSLRDGTIAAIAMRSSNTSYGLQKRLGVDLGAYPELTWKWRVDALPAGGDFRRGPVDDQAAQLYIAFSLTRVIGYIWDTSAPAGTIGDVQGTPPLVRARVIVLRSGIADSGRWLTEKRDLVADYRLAFGEEPPKKAIGIRLHINSQHTGGTAACAFADLAFKAP